MVCSCLCDTTITYNDWCLGQAKRRTLFQAAMLFLYSQITHCVERYKKKGLYLRALHLILYKPCLSPLKWGRKAWQRYLWKAAGPKEAFIYFSGKKVLSWTAVDGGIDDLAIKTLVEELRDLDSIGQIFCLALGQLLWFVVPLFSCWKVGMAGFIFLAGVQGDRWCRVLGYKIEKLKNSQKSKAAASASEGFWESKIQLTPWSSSTTREAGRPQAGISAELCHWAHLFLAGTPGGQCGHSSGARSVPQLLAWWSVGLGQSPRESPSLVTVGQFGKQMAAKIQSCTPFLPAFQNVLVLHSVQNVISKSSTEEH